MGVQGKYWFWRDTSLSPDFLGVDSRAALPFVLFIVHMRLWTLMLALSSVVVLGVLAKFGYTVPFFMSKISRSVAGKVVMARPWWYWERFLSKVDQGRN